MTSPPSFQFRPLDEHIDGGFGATADAFLEAAKRLEEQLKSETFFHASLPICYLYRHATELYLKSLIVVIHRCLDLPFGQQSPSESPAIRMGDRWFPIYRVHSVSRLHAYFRELMDANMNRLLDMSDTDWRTMPQELADWVTAIEQMDEKSTFFRYPGADNVAKSDFQESSIPEIRGSMGPDDPPSKAVVELDANDRVISAFRYDPSGLDRPRAVLREASNELSVLHFAFRCDLAGGR